ncbi:MAG: hypothetical protein KJ583_07130 [Nanoarchaeota archaeon]|nr:hypothetical protein [Nanoarchaeota archaeon]MBU1269601.1 hypothetical protein [Nanoarchaeota archaeon]MBU1605059.1 hypothetical protein [Nanoarchaeota archaeon]MBU2442613.1 hypothetical protein [Nanoarchaeota archaeon]
MLYGQNTSSFYQHDNTIFYEYNNFDQKDNRIYNYCFSFAVEEFKKALEDLKRVGHVEILKNVKDNIESSRTFSMNLQNDQVLIALSGFGGSSQSGALVYGTVRDSKKLEDLLFFETSKNYEE